MSIRTTLHFHADKPEEMRAYKYLDSLGRKKSRVLTKLINAHLDGTVLDEPAGRRSESIKTPMPQAEPVKPCGKEVQDKEKVSASAPIVEPAEKEKLQTVGHDQNFVLHGLSMFRTT